MEINNITNPNIHPWSSAPESAIHPTIYAPSKSSLLRSPHPTRGTQFNTQPMRAVLLVRCSSSCAFALYNVSSGMTCLSCGFQKLKKLYYPLTTFTDCYHTQLLPDVWLDNGSTTKRRTPSWKTEKLHQLFTDFPFWSSPFAPSDTWKAHTPRRGCLLSECIRREQEKQHSKVNFNLMVSNIHVTMCTRLSWYRHLHLSIQWAVIHGQSPKLLTLKTGFLYVSAVFICQLRIWPVLKTSDSFNREPVMNEFRYLLAAEVERQTRGANK